MTENPRDEKTSWIATWWAVLLVLIASATFLLCGLLLDILADQFNRKLHSLFGGQKLPVWTDLFLNTHLHNRGVGFKFGLSALISLAAVYVFCLATKRRTFAVSFLVGFSVLSSLFIFYIIFMLSGFGIAFVTHISGPYEPPPTFFTQLFSVIPVISGIIICILSFHMLIRGIRSVYRQRANRG